MAKTIKNTSAKKRTSSKTAAVKNKTAEIEKKSVIIKKDTSKVNPELTDAFIQEVDEEVKNDNLKVLWNRYGVMIIAFVVLAVSAAVSFDQIRLWKTAQNQKRTENYVAATQLKENPQDTLAALQQITQQNSGIFSDFARLQIANVLFNQNKTEEALTELENIYKDKEVNEEVKHIALVKLATYKVDTLSAKEFAELVRPLTVENSSWTPVVQDLLAMSAIKNGDIEPLDSLHLEDAIHHLALTIMFILSSQLRKS